MVSDVNETSNEKENPVTLTTSGLKTPVYSTQHLSGLNSHLDLINALTSLESVEFQVDESLSKLISSNEKLVQPLKEIGELKPRVKSLINDTCVLSDLVNERAAVAERISGKVRVLDLEQSRVKECIDRVQAATELKDAFGQIFQAIERMDWEVATRHVQRANALDKDFLISKFAEAVVPTADIPDPPLVALDNFIVQLTEIFLRSFESAARSKDEATTTRFFKLFPLLGLDASATGLKAYSDFVRTLISVPPSLNRPADGTRAASVVAQCTSVFEQLALIIDQHQGMVEKYYGNRSMVIVVEQLNIEMDKLILKFVSEWQSDRQVERRLAGVLRSSFSPLTQLLASNQQAGSTNIINSPSALQSSLRSLAGNVQRSYNLQTGPSSNLNSAVNSTIEEEIEDPREIDGLVSEMAGLSARWQTYCRFLYSRFAEENDHENDVEDKKKTKSHEGEVEDQSLNLSSPTKLLDNQSKIEDKLFRSSKVDESLHSLLSRYYLPLEMWYLRINIEKAHISDEIDLNSPPYLSSALDDTFFMTKKVVYRLINTGQAECIKSGLDQVKEILERDFGDVMKRRLEGVYGGMGASSGASSGVVGGGFGLSGKTGDEKERRERATRNLYIVYLNNLNMASEYTIRLVEEAITGPALHQSLFISNKMESAQGALENLKQAEKKFGASVKSGLEQLFNQLIRPRIRSILSDCYKDVSYSLNEESYAAAEFQDLFKKRFCRAWEILMEPYREALTPKNFHEFFSMTVNVLVRPWETIIRNMKFNELGSIRFDKDLRSITSYLSNQTNFGISLINDSFIRLRQISLLLGLNEDEEDLKDFLVSESVAWRLTMSEIKGILSQKC
ncbi:COG4 transport protein-domain-containing protein [Phakopsora pachyrhizi]|uniref:Conserved oligomeric Golgi complex subunit 4 n=1 Tax=Phakopsora pachyrhizi TaxID=170000 RepID=A0AAV0ATG1_PHAPC|nr:COG4 transport protein-domain-containing protein [Phakopsora pachyrhizi]CAH7672834.1 COG4 transport protein-domain-containing protein [Phakopsora pachyrhizi]